MRRQILATLLVVAPLAAAAQPRPAAARHGFSMDRLARIDGFLQGAVDSGRIAGAVALVTRDGDVVYERAVGWADREAGRRMTADAVFRIASQSKALTSTAIMMLVEQGRIDLSEPVRRYIPSFTGTMVASRADTGRTLVPAKRAITIRDLLTQTAGISYGTDAAVAERYAAVGLGRSAGFGWYLADKDEDICTSMERLGHLPIVAQPGEQWVYGYATDILGCVVERVSGTPLDVFLRTHITAPLGMPDTRFFLPAAQRDRLTAVYVTDSTGHAVRAPNGPRGQGDYVDGPRRDFSGGAGLLSTARDYARFLQAMLGHGAVDGVRLLAPKTVDVMTSNQVGTLYTQEGMGFGLGYQVVQRPGALGLATVGSYGWAGAYGSIYLVDPAEGLVIVYMTQQLPVRTPIADRLSTLVYQALVSPRDTLPHRAPR